MMKRTTFISMLVIQLLLSGIALAGQLRCHVCGEPIPEEAKYYQANGGREIFCERCYFQAPRCSVCKLPTAAGAIDKDTGACPSCLSKLPRCKACGKPILGPAYTFSEVKGFYCPDCKNNRPACYICGAPVGADYWSFPDGRVICGECGGRAVIDVNEIQGIMRNAREVVERRLGLVVRDPFTVTVEKLGSISPAGSGNRYSISSGQSPLYGRELGLYRRSGDKSEIFLLFGLPPELLYEAAAHEYAHAWQAENCPAQLSPELREGFAQWVAAEVLRTKNYRSALEKLEARKDFPYGTGYQRLRNLHRRIVLDLVQRGN